MSEGDSTRASLLIRLRNPADAQAWVEFDARYRDLIVRFARARGLQAADAEDVAQDVVRKLVAGLRGFEYDARAGGFRRYLFRCVRNRLADHWARQGRGGKPVSLEAAGGSAGDPTAALGIRGDARGGWGARGGGDPDGEDLFAEFEREWIDHHYRRAMDRLKAGSEARTADVLDRTVAGRTARQIGEELGMSEDAVHKAQQRIRDRLKAIIAEQLADEEGHAP